MPVNKRIVDHPFGGKYIRPLTLKEYSSLFKDFFLLKRKNGILEIAWHTDHGSVLMDPGHAKAWSQLLDIAGADPENEVLILTGTGDKFIGGTNPEYLKKLMEQGDDVTAQIGSSYDDVYLDGLEAVRSLLFNVHVPTIGVYNGPSQGMQQMMTMCDLTLCAEDVVFDERHFIGNKMPGNGPFLAMQKYLGEKRANYMLFTGKEISAAEAKEQGLVNEVLPRKRLLPRAWEIAGEMMKKDREIRRLSHDLACRGLRRSYIDELEYQMALSTYGHVMTASKTLDSLQNSEPAKET